jgi:hypothetical protein
LQTEQPRRRSPLEVANAFKVAAAVAVEAWSTGRAASALWPACVDMRPALEEVPPI